MISTLRYHSYLVSLPSKCPVLVLSWVPNRFPCRKFSWITSASSLSQCQWLITLSRRHQSLLEALLRRFLYYHENILFGATQKYSSWRFGPLFQQSSRLLRFTNVLCGIAGKYQTREFLIATKTKILNGEILYCNLRNHLFQKWAALMSTWAIMRVQV